MRTSSWELAGFARLICSTTGMDFTRSDSGSSLSSASSSTRSLAAASSSSSSSSASAAKAKVSWLYGCRMYERQGGAGKQRFLHDFRALIWATYRKNMIELTPKSGLKSDGGWGCMLRSAQSLLANVFRLHLRDAEEKEVLTWFVDSPHIGCPYSIHSMVQYGLLRGKQPGEWYGPQTVSHVLREMVEAHEERTGRPALRILVADEGTVYTDDVYKKMCSLDESVPSPAKGAAAAAEGKVGGVGSVGSGSEISGGGGGDGGLTAGTEGEGKSDEETSTFDPLLNMTPTDEAQWRSQREPWEQGLLILIPVRLGLDKINPCYHDGERRKACS